MKRLIKASDNVGKWENYGDVNFLDGGCVVRKEGNDYHIIRCDFVWDMGDDPAHYMLSNVMLDIDDSWIDVVEVEKWVEIKDRSPEWFAVDTTSYYGPDNCGGTTEMMTAQEVEDYMSNYNIPSDIYFSEN